MAERLLLESRTSGHATHVIDDEWHRQPAQQIVIGQQIRRIEVHIDVPAQWTNARHDAVELVHIRHAAQVSDEIEAHTAKAGSVQIAKGLLGERAIRVCNSAIATAALSDGVHYDGIVGAMTAGVHEHRTRESE